MCFSKRQKLYISNLTKYFFIIGLVSLFYTSFYQSQIQIYLFLFTLLSGFIFFILNISKINIKEESKVKNFTLAFILLALAFIAIRLGIPLFYTGSYIDEYNHILSGIEFFESGEFIMRRVNSYYTRGSYVSVATGLSMLILGQTLFAAKMVPAIIGIVNFFLLYKISSKIFLNKYYTLLLLLIYTISPWLIVNHFYIRAYVFFEFFILLLTFLLLLIIQKYKNLYLLLIYSTLVLITIFVVYTKSNDPGMYMVLLYTGILISYFYFFELKKLNTKAKTLIYLIALVPIILYIDVPSLWNTFFNITIHHTSGEDFKYDNLFVNLNFGFTLFFLFSIILLFVKKIDHKIKALIIATLTLFTIHLVSIEDLQTTRTITYLLPMFFLVSIYSLSVFNKLFKENVISILIILTLIGNVIINYPADFFDGPHIPTELNYTKYKDIGLFLKEECPEENIFAFIHNPYILNFYGVEIHYIGYIRTASLEADSSFFYNEKTDAHYSVYKEIPVLENMTAIKNKMDKEPSCAVISKDPSNYHRYFEREEIGFLEDNKKVEEFRNILVFY